MLGTNLLQSSSTPFYVSLPTSYGGLGSIGQSSYASSQPTLYGKDRLDYIMNTRYTAPEEVVEEEIFVPSYKLGNTEYLGTNGGSSVSYPVTSSSYTSPFSEREKQYMDNMSTSAMLGTTAAYAAPALATGVSAGLMGVPTNQAIGMALGGPTAAAGLLGTLAANASGVEIHSGLGNAVVSGLAGMALGPVGGFLGAAVAPFAVDGVMDAFNARENEQIRDAYEDAYDGYFDGRRVGTYNSHLLGLSNDMASLSQEQERGTWSPSSDVQALSAYSRELANGRTEEQAAAVANAYTNTPHNIDTYNAASLAYGELVGDYNRGIYTAFENEQNKSFVDSLLSSDEDDTESNLEAVEGTITSEALSAIGSVSIGNVNVSNPLASYTPTPRGVNPYSNGFGLPDTEISVQPTNVTTLTSQEAEAINQQAIDTMNSINTNTSGSSGNSFSGVTNNNNGYNSNTNSSGNNTPTTNTNAPSSSVNSNSFGGGVFGSSGNSGAGMAGSNSSDSGPNSGNTQGGADNGEGNTSGFGR